MYILSACQTVKTSYTRGGGRQSNQVGLIDLQGNISIVKIKIYAVLSKSGGAAVHSLCLIHSYLFMYYISSLSLCNCIKLQTK